MFSSEDDGDFAASIGSSRLSSLFGVTTDEPVVPKDSLSYTAPKQPRKQTVLQTDSSDRKPAPGGGSGASSGGIVLACAVHCYRLVNGQYASQGQVGAALLSNSEKTEYRILLYVTPQKPVANATITSSFVFAVQPNRYATIYDDTRQTFSLLFDGDAGLSNFAKEVAIAKANILAARSDGQVTSLINQDLLVGEGNDLQNGDAAEIRYTGFFFSNGAIGKEFDSNSRSDKLLRVRVGKGSVIKGWEQGMVGMKRGGKRLLIIPPQLAYGDAGVSNRIPPRSTLVFEVELVKVKTLSGASVKVDAAAELPSSGALRAVHQAVSVPQFSQADVEVELLADQEPVRARRQSVTEQPTQGQAVAQKHSDKASLVNRMAKLGTAMLPMAHLPGPAGPGPSVSSEDAPFAGGQIHEQQNASSVPHLAGTTTQPGDNMQLGFTGTTNSSEQQGTSQQVLPLRVATPAAENMAGYTSAGPQYHPMHGATHGAYTSTQQHLLAVATQPPSSLAPVIAAANAHHLQLLQQMGQYGATDGQYINQHGLVYDTSVLATGRQPVAGPIPNAGNIPTAVPNVITPYGILPGAGGLVQPMHWNTGSMTPGSGAGSRFTENARNGAAHPVDTGGASTTLQRMADKIDTILSKVDVLQDSLAPTQTNMETATVVQNIRRIAEENEKLKKDVTEKTAKIEAQNLKISELLQQNQRAVEQSNEMLEQRNDTYKATATQSQARVLLLEQEKIHMGEEMSSLMSQLSQLQLHVASLKKKESDLSKDVASVSNAFKVTQDELISANQHVSEKDAQLLDMSQKLKEEKRCRREADNRVVELNEELSDLRSGHDTLQKALTDRKRKAAEERKALEAELDDLRLRHQEEVTSLKTLMQRQSASSEQEVLQMEQVNASWKRKLEDAVAGERRKHQEEVAVLQEDADQLKAEVASLRDVSQHLKQKASETDRLRSDMATLAASNDELIMQLQTKINENQMLTSEKLVLTAKLSDVEFERAALVERLADQKLAEELQAAAASWKEKYEKLRAQASDMKLLYEGEISKLRSTVAELEAAAANQKAAIEREDSPDRESAVDKVKSVMNIVYQSFKKEIDPVEQYRGSDVLQVALTIIKRETLRLVEVAEQANASDTPSDEEYDTDADDDSEVEGDETPEPVAETMGTGGNAANAGPDSLPSENDQLKHGTAQVQFIGTKEQKREDHGQAHTSAGSPETEEQNAEERGHVDTFIGLKETREHKPAAHEAVDSCIEVVPLLETEPPRSVSPWSSGDSEEDGLQPPPNDNQESDAASGTDIVVYH